MDKKPNKNNLVKAIKKLPTYDPNEAVWSVIEQGLILQEGIQRLPTYSPSAKVWEGIATDLPVKKLKVIRWKKISIAAAILLLLGMSWWLQLATHPQTQLSFKEEIINPQLLIEDWEGDEDLINQIEAFCKVQQVACIDPAFQVLEMELEELTAAKTAIKMAIENYGKDLELIAQLSKIELERTSVLKKMMANIL